MKVWKMISLFKSVIFRRTMLKFPGVYWSDGSVMGLYGGFLLATNRRRNSNIATLERHEIGLSGVSECETQTPTTKRIFFWAILFTLPETNSSPLKIGRAPKRN